MFFRIVSASHALFIVLEIPGSIAPVTSDSLCPEIKKSVTERDKGFTMWFMVSPAAALKDSQSGENMITFLYLLTSGRFDVTDVSRRSFNVLLKM